MGLFIFINSFSQDAQLSKMLTENHPSVGFSATVHRGAILPHRKQVSEIVAKATHAYELSFYKRTFGKKEWQQLHHYPQLGISVIAINLGNKEQLGNGYGVFSFIELPSNHYRKISWNVKIGYGLGYIEKPFNRITNFKNVAIGSYFNAIIYANSNWKVKFSKAINFSVGLSIIHFSNASFSKPNLGINIFSLNTGLSYQFGKKENFVINTIHKRPHKWTKSLRGTVGVKEISPAAGPKYFVSAYSFNFIKVRAAKSSFGFGADLFYNTSLKQAIKNEPNSTRSNFDSFRLGLGAIYLFDFGKISLAIEMGGYVFSKYKKEGVIYNRLFTKFNTNNKLFFTVGLKTHYFVADFPEFGIGYTFN